MSYAQQEPMKFLSVPKGLASPPEINNYIG